MSDTEPTKRARKPKPTAADRLADAEKHTRGREFRDTTGRPANGQPGGNSEPSVTEEMKPAIVEAFMLNGTWRSVCEEFNISQKALNRALRADEKFATAYREAKEIAQDFTIDDVKDIAKETWDSRNLDNAKEVAAAGRAAMEGLIKIAEKRAPRDFGQLVKLGGDKDFPLEVAVVSYSTKPSEDDEE